MSCDTFGMKNQGAPMLERVGQISSVVSVKETKTGSIAAHLSAPSMVRKLPYRPCPPTGISTCVSAFTVWRSKPRWVPVNQSQGLPSVQTHRQCSMLPTSSDPAPLEKSLMGCILRTVSLYQKRLFKARSGAWGVLASVSRGHHLDCSAQALGLGKMSMHCCLYWVLRWSYP